MGVVEERSLERRGVEFGSSGVGLGLGSGFGSSGVGGCGCKRSEGLAEWVGPEEWECGSSGVGVWV